MDYKGEIAVSGDVALVFEILLHSFSFDEDPVKDLQRERPAFEGNSPNSAESSLAKHRLHFDLTKTDFFAKLGGQGRSEVFV